MGIAQHYVGITQNHEGIARSHVIISQHQVGRTRNHVSIARNHVKVARVRMGIAQNHVEIARNHVGITQNHVEIERSHTGITHNRVEIARNHVGIALNHLRLALNRLRLAQTTDQARYLLCSYEHFKYTVKATATIPITASAALSIHSSRSLTSCPRFNLPKKHPCTYNTAHRAVVLIVRILNISQHNKNMVRTFWGMQRKLD